MVELLAFKVDRLILIGPIIEVSQRIQALHKTVHMLELDLNHILLMNNFFLIAIR